MTLQIVPNREVCQHSGHTREEMKLRQQIQENEAEP